MIVRSKGLAAVLASLFSMTVHAHAGHDHSAPNHDHSGAHPGHAQHHHAHQHAHEAQDFPDSSTVAAPEGVSVSDCWIRAMPNRLPSAAYFRLQNDGSKDVSLIGAQSQGFGKVMLHTHKETQGMAAMVHVDEVVVPAGGEFNFEPRGHHVMLMQPAVDLKVGSQHPITLWFEGPLAKTLQCDVRPPGTLS